MFLLLRLMLTMEGQRPAAGGQSVKTFVGQMLSKDGQNGVERDEKNLLMSNSNL